MVGAPILWTARSANAKTGDVPQGFVGATRQESWSSCDGCGLRDDGSCYAWSGTVGGFALPQVQRGYANDAKRYDLISALKLRSPSARMVRLGAIGDPARADRGQLYRDIGLAALNDLSIVGYTHFWREPANRMLASFLMASCDSPREAEHALALGWTPATVIPWDHVGRRFRVGAVTGVVCPAQTKSAVTCNDCRMCDPSHEVWRVGKVSAIGFLDHSPRARAEARKGFRQLDLFSP